ncbi:MAG: hypothetical protein GY941_22790, partial [Planctomycetes bacterium]|nr:hypothetical protein [Planctomycetota bacterium]
HPAGGNVLCYLELAQHMGEDQPFYGLQAFGMEAGQVAYTQISDMAKFYLDEVKALHPHGPYQLAGWSSGGLVAFEMARQLQEQGKPVSLLALLDTAVPSTTQEHHGPEDDVQLLVDLFTEGEISISLDHLKKKELTPDEQLAYVVEQAKHVDFIPPDVDLTQAQRFMQVYKNNAKAGTYYHPHSYRGKIILFRATERDEDISLEPDFGWGDHATGGVEIIPVPGNHKDMVKPPHVPILAEKLKLYLKDTFTQND